MTERVSPLAVAGAACLLLLSSAGQAQDLCFEAARTYAAGDAPSSVFAADLDGDNDADLAIANSYGHNVSVLFNNGDGTFAATVNYATEDSPVSVFAADLDGDNDADLAVANRGSDNVSVLKNNGDGIFAAAVNYAAGNGPRSVFAADLDGDNDADLVVANISSNNVSVLKNNGDGSFAAAVHYSAGDGSGSVFSADLDGDNDADLAVANFGAYSDDVSVLKNNGDGTFAAAVKYDAGSWATSVFAADLDGDNDADLAVANENSDDVSVLKNNGDGTFAAAVNYATGSIPLSVFAADLDGDNDVDLAVANGWGNVSVLTNSGDGTFSAAVNHAAGSSAYSVFAVDLDGDNDVDLAIANFHSDSVTTLTNCVCADAGVTSPDEGTLLPPDGARGPTSVTFEWGAVPDVAGYGFRIDTVDRNFQHIWIDTTLDNAASELQLAIPARDVFWQVRGLGDYCCGPWTSPSAYTDVRQIRSSTLPESYAMQQNYPNPFNSSTVIEFTIERDSHVKLEVFNILGQVVITLTNEFLSYGTYAVDWDGTDRRGIAVASGMYFYRLTTSEFVQSKKMVLLK